MEKSKVIINNNTNNILFILKNIIMLFACLIVYQAFPEYWTNFDGKFGYINTKAIISISGILVLIYGFWMLMNIYIANKSSNTMLLKLGEILFYNAIIALPLYASHSYESEFKSIFLLVIIVTIIQGGLRYGVIAALMSAVVILGVDLAYAPKVNSINTYFEKDLILAGVFILVAWILGYYVDLENENKKARENRLEQLDSELKEQSKQRNNIQEALFKNDICFDMLFENSQNAIVVHKNDEIIYVNESAVKLLGYDGANLINIKKLSSFYADNRVDFLKQKYQRIVDSKLSKLVEEEIILNASGETTAVRNTSSFFVYEGQPAVLTFLLDITTEKQLETLKNDAEKNLKLLNETREFNILITDFFINISHEIKTPINIIYTAIQTTEMYLGNYNDRNIAKCKEYIKTMKQNCFRMIRLVNNLLDITRFDSGFIKLNRKNNDIVRVVEDITQSVAVYVKSKDIELIFDTNVEEKITAFDEDKIERIMLNLLSNAFKYSPVGGKIEVNFEEQGNSVIISVKDNGEGISKESLDIIFERFGQANRSLSRKHEGSGIGLYLVKSFVEMHNGSINVNSVEGEGTEFTIVLPIKIVEEDSCKSTSLFETNIERINIEFSDIYT